MTGGKSRWLALLTACAALAASGGGWELAWDYGALGTNIVFEVWRSNQPETNGNWVRWIEVSTTNCPMPATGRCGFFKVRARDTTTGLLSDWALARRHLTP